jgi:hypothetical protein
VQGLGCKDKEQFQPIASGGKTTLQKETSKKYNSRTVRVED